MSYQSIYKKDLFKGKIALVTGATGGGVGTTVATQISLLGAKVILNGKNEQDLKKLAKKINAHYYVADVSDKSAVKSMFNWIKETFSQLDILINNAAYGGPKQKIFELDYDVWIREQNVNLRGAFLCSKYASNIMSKEKYGKIIFMSSSAALRGTRGRNVGYAASKSALFGLTKQMALELGVYNINVNVICPSQIDTPRIRRNGRKTEKSIREYSKTVPLQRVGNPEDISNLILFLASDASSYITGQILNVDGGVSLAPVNTNSYK